MPLYTGHLVPLMKERFGEKVKFSVYGQKRRLFQRMGMSLLGDAVDLVEENAAYAKYGL